MLKKVLSPLQRFVQIESFSGILLFVATLLALGLANSPVGDTYKAFWDFKFGFTTPFLELNKPLLLWVNDGLMAIFFFLIGLEIKREFLIGELNSLRKVSFPLFGALGGMLVPVLLFVVLNVQPETAKGWGIPMATDIAFSLAILKLLGKKAPLSLKVFLTAFAIVDDLGAVLVIAIFYSGVIKYQLLLYAGGLLAILYAVGYTGRYYKFLTTVFAIVIWTLFLKAGIHPTLAGILIAFSVPVRKKITTTAFVEELMVSTQVIEEHETPGSSVLSNVQIEAVDTIQSWVKKVQSPLQHLEHKLHDWVAYFIIPIFALANAGVVIDASVTLDTALMINIAICLVLGNFMGITAIILTVRKLGWIDFPEDLNKTHIVGVSFLAGVGFTMAIFIASLAFPENAVYLTSAKIGILIGSFISGILGYLILRFNAKRSSQNTV